METARRGRRRATGALGLAVGALLLAVGPRSEPARAAPLEKLVMPGPVAEVHAKTEAECGKCHQPFKRGVQAGLCLACHEDVGADLRAHSGFHGRSPAAAGADCRTCHPEHQGRAADIVGLDRASFAHDATDFPLHGSHLRVPCDGCHAQGKKLREAPSRCSDCHAKDDAHAGRMGADCASCHADTSWREARFDHAKTRFPLEGSHAKVQCALCHPGERYEGTPTDCGTCHALNDAHQGRFGTKCESCHATSGWKTSRFDHARDTRFPLTGRHGAVACEACHVGGVLARKLGTDCLSCHRTDDVHDGRNGPRCEQCHSTTAWKPATFDHDRDTKFPLRGAHRPLTCTACHTGPVHEQRLEKDCASCHRKDDVHRGQQGTDCGRCHNEAGWKDKVKFDHDLTRFPLLGMHAVAACEECHTSAAYRGTERACVACHERGDDPHDRKLGASCELCHNPNAWALWRFDHATQTAFPLAGAHATVSCESCHRSPVEGKITLSKDCWGCHAADDPHHDAFGRRCQQCHGESSWTDVQIRR